MNKRYFGRLSCGFFIMWPTNERKIREIPCNMGYLHLNSLFEEFMGTLFCDARYQLGVGKHDVSSLRNIYSLFSHSRISARCRSRRLIMFFRKLTTETS
jgi:hypothetical protein